MSFGSYSATVAEAASTGLHIASAPRNWPVCIAQPTFSFIQVSRKHLDLRRWRVRRAAHRSWEFAGATWTVLFVIIKSRGRWKTVRKRLPLRLKSTAQRNCPSWAGTLPGSRGICIAGQECLRNFFAFIASFAQTTAVFNLMVNDDHRPFLIRGYRESDREAVRTLCCDTGFLGDPIDPVYEDRELFADFLTTYYTDHEPESCFL